MLTKPWALYVFRHYSLSEKSQILSDSALKDHAGWSTHTEFNFQSTINGFNFVLEILAFFICFEMKNLNKYVTVRLLKLY
jgi:hypothetical protein